MKLGSIPVNLKIFIRPKVNVKFKFDDIEAAPDVAVVSAYPAFVTDATNPKTQLTAERWAKGYWRGTDKFTTEERPNTPTSNVRIIGLDVRGNGGRAWQVLVDDTYIFDMREDVLMDSLLHIGAEVGAKLNGEFIFASVNSEMKIIRVGSLLHDKMIESTAFNNTPKIESLEVGGIYRNKKATVIYLGEVNTREFKRNETGRKKVYAWETTSFDHRVWWTADESQRKYLTIQIEDKNKTPAEKMTSINQLDGFYYWNLGWNSKPSKSFREKIGQLDSSAEEILAHIKKHMIKEYKVNETLPKDHLPCYSLLLNAEVTKTDYLHPLIQPLVQ